ncbi:MAG: 1-deoxy-D-xylulose-5-phosphate reductoisomerase [Pseudomonadota bacterium]
MSVNTSSARAKPAGAVRSLTLLGATGSIGGSTVDLIKRGKGRYRVEAVVANKNAAQLAQIARDIGARFAVVSDASAYKELKDALSGTGIEAASGEAALLEAAERPAEWVLGAMSGAVGLKPTLAALKRGATVAIANKECLVCAGGVFMRTAAKSGATVLPVDSEHNAIFQALGSGRREDVKLVILTASGGPFRTWTKDQMRTATLEQALKHPNWSMGPKNTIDSATMMNKGLELIEAQHIFGLKPHELDVLVHPQSIVHGLVEYRDGSVVAQLGSPDMRIPIAHCLAWPERIDGPAERLNLARIGNLTFEAPDTDRFPALAIARRVLEAGGATPTVFNAANEIAVASFVERKLSFAGIAALVQATIDAAERRNATNEPETIEDALAVDHIARSLAQDLLPEIAAKSS